MATPCPPGRRGKLARVQPMAVATREYGLFIGGESTEAVSGEARELAEPATGEPLARVATAGEAAVERALAPPARARRRARREPQGARRARGPKRRQGDLLGQGRAQPGGRELPLLRLRDRVDRGALEPDRRLAPLLLAEGAGRGLRADRAVELPADDGDVEARARARGRLHGCPEAGLGDAAVGAADGRARDRGGLS